jgi:hypothetical protein
MPGSEEEAAELLDVYLAAQWEQAEHAARGAALDLKDQKCKASGQAGRSAADCT